MPLSLTQGVVAAAHVGLPEAHHHVAHVGLPVGGGGSQQYDPLHREVLPEAVEEPAGSRERERERPDHDRERERGAAASAVPHLPADSPHHHLPSKPGLRLLMHFHGPRLLITLK